MAVLSTSISFNILPRSTKPTTSIAGLGRVKSGGFCSLLRNASCFEHMNNKRVHVMSQFVIAEPTWPTLSSKSFDYWPYLRYPARGLKNTDSATQNYNSCCSVKSVKSRRTSFFTQNGRKPAPAAGLDLSKKFKNLPENFKVRLGNKLF